MYVHMQFGTTALQGLTQRFSNNDTVELMQQVSSACILHAARHGNMKRMEEIIATTDFVVDANMTDEVLICVCVCV